MVAREYGRCFRSPFVGARGFVYARAGGSARAILSISSSGPALSRGAALQEAKHASSRRALEGRRVFLSRERRRRRLDAVVRLAVAADVRRRLVIAGVSSDLRQSLLADRWTFLRSDGDLSLSRRKRDGEGWRYVDFRPKLTGSPRGGRAEGHRDRRQACRYHPENVISTPVTAYLFPSGVRARARVLRPYARRVIDFSAIVCDSRRR